MTTIATRRAIASPVVAIGLLLLGGCMESYREACTNAGNREGTAAFDACVEEQLNIVRADRTRNLKYSGGR